MIVYKDVFGKLADAGYNTTRIRKEKVLPESTMSRIRKGEGIRLESLETICKLTGCKIDELVEFKN